MKNLTFFVLLLAVVVALVIAIPHLLPERKPVTVVSSGPTIERLEKLSHLVTMRAFIADVLIGEGEGCRGAWLIKGDAIIGINLSRARIIKKDEEARRAVIQLPLPELIQARVDHERTRTWEVRKTTWIPWGGDQDKLRDYVMGEAQKLVAQAAASHDNISQAKTGAETLIRNFFAEVGWEVTVTWEGTAADASVK